MALRRKFPFYIEVKPPSAHRALPAYLDRRPEADYYPLGSIDTAWIGQRRNWRLRQLVTIQQLKSKVVSELNCLAQITHENIAQPIALYSEKDELHIVYEYMDLDLFDLLPLSETEISSVMKQARLTYQTCFQKLICLLDHKCIPISQTKFYLVLYRFYTPQL